MKLTDFVKSVQVSPRKIRLVADAVRSKSATDAIAILSLVRKRGSDPIMKVLKSAVANAVHNAKLSESNLMIKQIEVSEGTSLKRFHASTRGRTHPYKKRTSHIRITLEERGVI